MCSRKEGSFLLFYFTNDCVGVVVTQMLLKCVLFTLNNAIGCGLKCFKMLKYNDSLRLIVQDSVFLLSDLCVFYLFFCEM